MRYTARCVENLTFIFFQALLQAVSQTMEVSMSEKSEQIVKIILPDLLNYLEMVESGEIIEKRLEKIRLCKQKEDDEEAKDDKIEKWYINIFYLKKKLIYNIMVPSLFQITKSWKRENEARKDAQS